MANARAKAEQADMAAQKAREDSDVARIKAKEFAPEFHQPGTDMLRQFTGSPDNQTDFSSLKPVANSSSYQNQSSSRYNEGEHRHLKRVRPSATSVLVSSALDCALAGTSAPIVEKLHAYETPTANHVPNNIKYDTMDSKIQPTEHHQQYGANPSMAPSDGYPYRNPSSKRSSLQREQPKRFTELLNSTVVSDHFDQYGTMSSQASETSSYYGSSGLPPHEDSGLGGADDYSPGYSDDISAQQPMTPMSPPIPFSVGPQIHQNAQQPLSSPQQPPQQQQPIIHASQPNKQISTEYAYPELMKHPPNPSAYNATARPLSRPLQRRKTLPSIMKRPPTIGASKTNATSSTPSSSGSNAALGESAQSANNLSKEDSDTYIIENGIRKRIKAEVYQTPPSTQVDEDKIRDLPKRYKLESSSNLRRAANRGSLPDFNACKELEKRVMPREEANKLSQTRRDELRKLREEEELRKQQEIVLRLSDLKDWCQERQLLMFVIAVNVSLATMFFNILSQ